MPPEHRSTAVEEQAGERLSTGIEGLDEILEGGLIPGRGYLIRGGPGSGKTLLGLHILQAGLDRGEKPLFISLEETKADLVRDAEGLGLDVEAMDVLDLSATAEAFGPGKSYDVFEPSDVESEEISEQIVQELEEREPDRVFLDPVTVLRHLSPDVYQFRRQILGLTRTIRERGATLILTSQIGGNADDGDLQFVTDGTIELGSQHEIRRISVPKFRGSSTASGPHTLRIQEGGMVVHPSLSPGKRTVSSSFEQIPSGVEEIDELLHGGLERGTTTIISGPTGAGKTTLGTQFMKEAAQRGERSSIYLFEESKETLMARSEAIGIPVGEMIDQGTLTVEEVEALGSSPQELAQMMRRDVEEDEVRIVMIDGLAGYRIATGGTSESLLRGIHALTRFLKNNGVTVLLVDELAEIRTGFQATERQVSYLADNVITLRHIELDGELRKIIGVLKKRVSDFERQLRELQITVDGIQVGEPLTGLRGVLTGNPEWVNGDYDRTGG